MSKLSFKNSFVLLTAAVIAVSGFFVVTGTAFAADPVLEVTQRIPVKTFAAADGTYANGWSWVFDVTVPTNETTIKMKFTDWVSGSNTIAAAHNIAFYSAQSSNAFDASHAITIDAADTYSGVMNLNNDDDVQKAGRQIRIIIEAAVPAGSAGGSYSTSYGINSANPDVALLATDKAALADASVKGLNPDLSNITVALANPLPAAGSNGSAITWASDNPLVVSNNGQTVNRPAFADGNATVTMTATITKGAVTDTKVFTLTVTKLPASTNTTIIPLGTYVVSDVVEGAATITNVPFGTARDDFLLGLKTGESHQIWNTTGIDAIGLNFNTTGIDAIVVNGNTLTVTAQDRTTVVIYTIAVSAEPSHVATVTTLGDYIISEAVAGAATITNVPFGTARDTFLGVLIPGQTDQIWDYTRIDAIVVNGNTLTVTAQDRTTVVIYTVAVKAEE